MFSNRQEFIDHYTKLIPPNAKWEQLNRSKAWVAEGEYCPIRHTKFYVVKSCSTIVAFYFPNDNSLYILGWYSQTTTTHITIFKKLFYVRTTYYLYRTSRRILAECSEGVYRGNYDPNKWQQDGEIIWKV